MQWLAIGVIVFVVGIIVGGGSTLAFLASVSYVSQLIEATGGHDDLPLEPHNPDDDCAARILHERLIKEVRDAAQR